MHGFHWRRDTDFSEMASLRDALKEEDCGLVFYAESVASAIKLACRRGFAPIRLRCILLTVDSRGDKEDVKIACSAGECRPTLDYLQVRKCDETRCIERDSSADCQVSEHFATRYQMSEPNHVHSHYSTLPLADRAKRI